MRYRAFISYSHSDARWATWLHRRLESYRVPQRLRGSRGEFGPLPERLTPIFRDREDLASAGELGPQIQAALADSEALIVVCSPEAARSHWVNQEILAFKRLGSAGRIYSLIVAGEPNAGDERECFPPALRFELDADGRLGTQSAEPIAADIRPGKDGKSLAGLKLLSGLLGVNLDSLRQREAQRRNQRLLAITALALVVMLVTSLLAVQAVIARRDAERRQKQAENLVGFMLGDLNDKLAQVQRLDILEAVYDQAMAYFQSLPTMDVTDEALAQRAEALQKIGSVRLDQGHLPAAMEAYRASLKLAAGLAAASPSDTAKQLAHGETLAFIGTTHWYQGDLDAAQHAYEASQRVLAGARARVGDDPDLLFQLADLDNNMGHVLEARGLIGEANVQYLNMLGVSQRLVSIAPDKAEWQIQLGAAHNNLGKMALLRGDLVSAVAKYRADEAIQLRLASRDPKNNDQRGKLLRVRAILGRTQALTGDVEAGIRGLRQAVDLAAELSGLDPDNTQMQELLALYSTQLGRLRRLAGDTAAAGVLSAQSMTVLGHLTRQDPANAGWQRGFAEAQLESAAQALAAGRAEEARAIAQAALTSLDTLLGSQPDDRATVLAAVAARLTLADLAEAGPAAQLRQQALGLIDRTKTGKQDPRLVALQVEALLGLGHHDRAVPAIDRLRASGYRDLALLAVLRRAGIAYPTSPGAAIPVSDLKMHQGRTR